jgi:hypothetical protein
MTKKDNILQELKELQSSLAKTEPQNIYHVPTGYFEDLADKMLNRIKALEAKTATEELSYLSPLLNSISKKIPYSVPAGFFDSLEKTIKEVSKNDSDVLTPAEELETLSPLLSGLTKKMPYSVPQGYFENLDTTLEPAAFAPKAKVVSLAKQTWFRYAAAAVVMGFIVMTGFLIFKPKPIDPNVKSFAWVEKNMKKVSTDEIDKFVEMADEEAPVVANVDTKTTNEIKDLIKDVSDKELEDFLEETPAEEPADNDDAIMN